MIQLSFGEVPNMKRVLSAVAVLMLLGGLAQAATTQPATGPEGQSTALAYKVDRNLGRSDLDPVGQTSFAESQRPRG